MNYENLTKKELIAIINDQKHLAEAVDQKDKEINRLTAIKAEEIAKIKNSTEAVKVSLEYQVQDLKDQLSKVPDLDKIKEHIDNLTNENNLFRTSLSQYINVFKNLLKSQQGVLDNSIELEAMLYEQITKNGENK